MTIEQALKINQNWTAEQARNDLERLLLRNERPANKVIALACKALEKQIPKKPLDICTPYVTWGLCPTCKGEMTELGGQPNRVFVNMAHCPDCGQKLDWEGIENVESK